MVNAIRMLLKVNLNLPKNNLIIFFFSEYIRLGYSSSGSYKLIEPSQYSNRAYLRWGLRVALVISTTLHIFLMPVFVFCFVFSPNVVAEPWGEPSQHWVQLPDDGVWQVHLYSGEGRRPGPGGYHRHEWPYKPNQASHFCRQCHHESDQQGHRFER